MNHNFDTVEKKIAEMEFFLSSMHKAGSNIFEFECYLSAYLAAARTSTLALQQFKHLPEFPNWYSKHQLKLKESPLANFFLDLCNNHIHGGPYPVRGGEFDKNTAKYYFSSTNDKNPPPATDILSAARDNFLLLLAITYDCYVEFGLHIDSQQYYTKEHFAALGRSIDDAEIEVCGWVCESLIEEGYDHDARWSELRGRVYECAINHLFYSYLGKVTPQPIEPEHYIDFAYTPEERGWLHTPAGYHSVEAYWAEMGIINLPHA